MNDTFDTMASFNLTIAAATEVFSEVVVEATNTLLYLFCITTIMDCDIHVSGCNFDNTSQQFLIECCLYEVSYVISL